MNRYLLLVAVSVFCLLSQVEGLAYEDCASKAKVENVQVSGCDGEKECILKRNTNVTITADITPTIVSTNVTTVVHGIIMDIPVAFQVPKPDACLDGGLECPLQVGKLNHYSALLDVKKAYPQISLKVKWELKDENDNDVMCLMIPVRIK